MKKNVSRREFLAGAGGIAVGAAAGGLVVGASQGSAADSEALDLRFIPFPGEHQAGITAEPTPARGLMASFTVVASSRERLQETLQELTQEIRGLMAGVPPVQRDSAFPPTDSGILGPAPAADDLSIVVSVGASLFDERYGLADQKPRELVNMPFIANDRLDPDRSHGDLVLTIQSEHSDHVIFALRQLMRSTRRDLTLKWVIDGFNRRPAPADKTTGSPRNLLGFIDGTANLSTQAELMDSYVWTVGGQGGEPAWTTGGVVPGRAGDPHVRGVLGPHRAGRAGGADRPPQVERRAARRGAETDVPDYAADPKGRSRPSTPTSAWPIRAPPRPRRTSSCGAASRYTRGFDGAGQLDQGLAFVATSRASRRLHGRAATPQRRAPRGVHPPRRRRLLLRAPGRDREDGLPRPGDVRELRPAAG